jgi:CO dehydrogenase/acetyl-CoA synthase beta subunit
MSMFKDIPVEVGVIYEGERIRPNDMQVEHGGPTVAKKVRKLQKLNHGPNRRRSKVPLSVQT